MTSKAMVSVIRQDIGTSATQADVHMDVGSQGNVTLASADMNNPLTLGAHSEYQGNVEITAGGLALAKDCPTDIHITVNSATLYLATEVDFVDLRGKCAINLPTSQAPTIKLLNVVGDAELRFPTGYTPVVKSLSGQDSAHLTIDGSGNSRVTWVVEDITSLKITAPARTRIQCQFLSTCEVVGPATIELAPLSTVSNLTLSADRNSHHPVLQAGNGTVLDALEGIVTLGVVGECHLIGSERGFLIADIRTSNNLSRADYFRGAVVSGFKTPEGLTGRRVLAAMTDAYHLDPNTTALPGSERDWWRQAKRWWHYSRADASARREIMRDLRQNAELIRELQRLVVEKGAPGSTRTKVAWTAYRLRHIGTTSRVEYLVLAGYRLLGYGERPVPAFATWLAASVFVAAAKLGFTPDWTWHGLVMLLGEAIRQALGPLTGLLHAGSTSFTSLWDYVARATVAVPLVTGLFAFRNYVKSRQG
ncbi:hypothetical protein ACFTSF_10135 [Kribbella sp. NPDC056951]|uniref:hypothetical protein n=1 Tax=Kribbella sp. NPDC056951 TaxID=3345978 RepID=UPI003629C447